MKSFQVAYSPRAEREMRGLMAGDRERIRQRINAYAAEPERPGHDVVPLSGALSGYRLRAGDWRILFDLDREKWVMRVQRVVHRREAYR